MLKNPPSSKSIWPFSPQSITGLKLWLDGADTSSITISDTSITQWNDKSGNGYNATVASGKTAAIYSTESNSVYFPASTTGYVTSCPADPITETMFVVFKNESPNDANNIIIGGQLGARSFGAGFSASGTGYSGILNNEVEWLASQGYYTSGATTMYTGISESNGQSTQLSQDGGPFSTYSTSNIYSSGTTTYLGVDTTTTVYYYIGYVMEIIFYDSVLSLSQRQQVEGYLAYKWNLSSLPATHPYYGLPVFNRVFQPVDITGCSLWLDAADESTITMSGSAVTQWHDKSGYGFVATPFDGAITKTTLNGNTVLDFSDNRMTIPNFTWNMSFTSIIVWKAYWGSQMIGLTASTASNAAWHDYISTGNWGLIMLNNNAISSSDPNYIRGPEDSYSGAPAPVVNANQWFIFSIGYTAGTTTITNYAVNGSARDANSVTSQTGTNTGVYFINGLSNGAYDYSQVAEIIHYNTSLTPSQRQQVESYLASKWKLQATLPSTHPGYRLPAYSVVGNTIFITFSPSSLTNMGVWLDPSDSTTVTLSGSSVTDITSKAVDENQINPWYSPYGGVIQRTINSRTAFGFPGGCLRNDSVYFPNGYNMSIFTIAQIPSDRPFINIFSKGITIQLKTDGIDVLIVSDDYSNGIFFSNTNGNQMPTDTNNIYFISIVITTPEDASQASCYCTINGVQTPMGLYDYLPTVPYDSETYLITDFGDASFDATTGESIICTDNKSIAECQQIEGYLAWKWGVQSFLQSTHPYKFTPP